MEFFLEKFFHTYKNRIVKNRNYNHRFGEVVQFYFFIYLFILAYKHSSKVEISLFYLKSCNTRLIIIIIIIIISHPHHERILLAQKFCTTKLSPNLQISLNMQLRVAEYDESYVLSSHRLRFVY